MFYPLFRQTNQNQEMEPEGWEKRNDWAGTGQAGKNKMHPGEDFLLQDLLLRIFYY